MPEASLTKRVLYFAAIRFQTRLSGTRFSPANSGYGKRRGRAFESPSGHNFGSQGQDARGQHHKGPRFGLNLISAVSPRREFRFMTIKARSTARAFIEYLKRLVHSPDPPVLWIVDGPFRTQGQDGGPLRREPRRPAPPVSLPDVLTAPLNPE
jgi:hypothetical protein